MTASGNWWKPVFREYPPAVLEESGGNAAPPCLCGRGAHHTVCVTRLAVAMAGAIGNVDLDLVIAGALLHDLGKIREISSDLGFPYTTEGRLMGHISIGAMAVDRAARKIPDLSADRRERLLHIILSHHGDQDKGSPVVCVTKEAFIVHYADEVDSIMNQFHEKERSESWEYDKMLQRYLWKV